MDICGSLLVAAGCALCTGAFIVWISIRKSKRLEAIVDLNDQSRQLSDESRIAGFLDGEQLKSYVYADVRTAYDAVQRGARLSKDGPMLGYRKKMSNGYGAYVWLTYQDVITRSENLALGLLSVGAGSGQKAFFGLYSRNRPEWIISEYAIYNLNGVVVPLYDTLGVDSLHFIINQCGLETVICETNSKAKELMVNLQQYPCLKRIILMDNVQSGTVKMASLTHINLYHFDEIQQRGNSLISKPTLQKPTPEDLCTICFTSGTTGIPKGVMLTHGNLVATLTMFFHVKHFPATPDQVIMSFLPLAHMYERIIEVAAFQIGARVGYYSGEVRHLLSDMQELRPTVVPVVPRVLNRIYDTVMLEVSKSVIKMALLRLAVAWKTFLLKRQYVSNDTWADLIVFKKIQRKMGGRVCLIFTGAAPVSDEVLQFSRAALGCTIVEGYGQTECVAACTANVEADVTTGHVGIPMLNTAIKLIDAPELGYFAKNKVGEICMRGPSVFKGYYKNEEATRQTLDKEGWLHSGDIGQWNDNGTLKIIDRKKFIFKLQQGEYIAPEKIESFLTRSLYVAQAFVYGESLKSCLIGVVVPEEQAILKVAAERYNLKSVSLNELCSNKAIKNFVLDDMNATGKDGGLCAFELVKDIYLTPDTFTVENGLLTPTFKNKRDELKKLYSTQLQEMYSRLK